MVSASKQERKVVDERCEIFGRVGLNWLAENWREER